jgi:hypothetical protein
MKTGVVLRKVRWLGGKDGYEVVEYEINSALIEALNSVQENERKRWFDRGSQ